MAPTHLVNAHVRACVHACVRACVRACVCVYVCDPRFWGSLWFFEVRLFPTFYSEKEVFGRLLPLTGHYGPGFHARRVQGSG